MTIEGLPAAAAVIDPVHVERPADNALDRCLRRVQQATCGHRGRKTQPLYVAPGIYRQMIPARLPQPDTAALAYR